MRREKAERAEYGLRWWLLGYTSDRVDHSLASPRCWRKFQGCPYLWLQQKTVKLYDSERDCFLWLLEPIERNFLILMILNWVFDSQDRNEDWIEAYLNACILLNWCRVSLLFSIQHLGTNYRGGNKGLFVLLSRTQAGPGRAVKQEQEEFSRNHVQTFISPSVEEVYKAAFLMFNPAFTSAVCCGVEHISSLMGVVVAAI